MSYIFRIHKSGQNQLKGWEKLPDGFSDAEIASIRDQYISGNNAKVGTSIPTPLARLFLFETSFRMVNNGSSEGNSTYHQLVSDCLDLLELLFLHGDRLTFKRWDCGVELDRLRNSKNKGHVLLGDSLNMALGRTSETKDSPMQGCSEFFLIYYENILLGGTSPLTLVFTSPNLRHKLRNKGITLRNTAGQILFGDNEANPLHYRSEAFRIFLQRIRYAFGDELDNLNFREFRKYIAASADGHRTEELANINHYSREEFGKAYKPIRLDAGTVVNVCGIVFSANEKCIDVSRSGFLLKNTVSYFTRTIRDTDLPTPLALIEGNHFFRYIDSRWNQLTTIPDHPWIPLNERKLPENGLEYPYVTVGDFLEDTLIDLSYDVNGKYFYTGFGSSSCPYLLPIKKAYFNFFRYEDLENSLRITKHGNIVEVDLEIPVSGGTLHFIRKYTEPGNKPATGLGETYFDIIKLGEDSMTLGIFPFYRIEKSEGDQAGPTNEYSIQLVDSTANGTAFSFYSYEGISQNRPIKAELYNRSDLKVVKSHVYQLKNLDSSSLDLLEVNINKKYTGLIIPRWKKVYPSKGTEKFTFGIDFGTSNTHIAYQTSNSKPDSFDITEEDMQMVLFYAPANSTDLREKYRMKMVGLNIYLAVFRREFMPSVIGNGALHSYPIKTASFESDNYANSESSVFGNINIGFDIDSEIDNRGGTYKTNLKWQVQSNPDDITAKNRIFAYCKQTLWMIKNKVLLNNGSTDINVVYFYPESMTIDTQAIFEKAWETGADEILKGFTVNFFRIVEAVAPYEALLFNKSIEYATNALNIDIGGGTTDLLYFAHDKKTKYSASALFAGNDIWGDGILNIRPMSNGFINMMNKRFNEKNNEFKNADLNKLFSDYLQKGTASSADLSGFLFKYDDEFNFTWSIKAHSGLKSILLLHYAAIIYYITDLLEKTNLEIPLNISFTGKGSEYIKIITDKDERITKLTRKLFEAFTDKPIPSMFSVSFTKNPKELTALGGVMAKSGVSNVPKEFAEGETVNVYSIGCKVDKQLEEKEYLNKELLSLKTEVLDNFEQFINRLFGNRELNEELEQYTIHLNTIDKDMVLHLAEKSFLQMAAKHESETRHIRSSIFRNTLFFWPLKNMLYDLSCFIVE